MADVILRVGLSPPADVQLWTVADDQLAWQRPRRLSETIVFDEGGRRLVLWVPDVSVVVVDQLAWQRPRSGFTETAVFEDSGRRGMRGLVPVASGLGSDQLAWQRTRRLSETILFEEGGRRLGSLVPVASALGSDQIPWRAPLRRGYDEPSLAEDAGRARSAGFLTSAAAAPVDQLGWQRTRRLAEAVVLDDGGRLGLGRWLPEASALGADQLAWQRIIRRIPESPFYDDGARVLRWIPDAAVIVPMPGFVFAVPASAAAAMPSPATTVKRQPGVFRPIPGGNYPGFFKPKP